MRLGCDVVDVDRFAGVLERQPGFVDRVFTAQEIQDCRRGGVEPGSRTEVERLAARFAAKEAARKALGDLSLGFRDTEVVTAEDGSPSLLVQGQDVGLSVSLSHDGGMAVAVVAGP